MSNKIPLSVIIIYDSTRPHPYLTQAKESVAIFSQIILYDVGTKPIVDFSEVRNKALQKAEHEYVLFLDSDEVLEATSIPFIKKIIFQKKYDLVSVSRSDVFLGKKLQYGEAGEIGLVRLGKKDAIIFDRAVHETVVLKPHYKVIGSNIRLLHYSHQNIASFLRKITYYAYLEAELRKKAAEHFSLFELIFFPLLKFLFNFFIRQGYRDGMRGLIYAVLMSLHSLFVRIYLYEYGLNRK